MKQSGADSHRKSPEQPEQAAAVNNCQHRCQRDDQSQDRAVDDAPFSCNHHREGVCGQNCQECFSYQDQETHRGHYLLWPARMEISVECLWSLPCLDPCCSPSPCSAPLRLLLRHLRPQPGQPNRAIHCWRSGRLLSAYRPLLASSYSTSCRRSKRASLPRTRRLPPSPLGERPRALPTRWRPWRPVALCCAGSARYFSYWWARTPMTHCRPSIAKWPRAFQHSATTSTSTALCSSGWRRFGSRVAPSSSLPTSRCFSNELGSDSSAPAPLST